MKQMNLPWEYIWSAPLRMQVRSISRCSHIHLCHFPLWYHFISSLCVHHCIKCLISVLGRALFFYQDFHFDFLLQYSLSYCWEDRPVSKEKPRSIRCFFSFLYFFLLLVVGISTTLPKKSWLRGLSSEYFSFETSLILAFLVCSNAEPFKIGLVP